MSAGMKIDLEVKFFDGRDWVSLVAYNELKIRLVEADKDIRELRSNNALTDVQVEENKKIHQENIDYKNTMDKIALFLREHYQKEINLGQHAGFKDLADCVVFYLGKERVLTQKEQG